MRLTVAAVVFALPLFPASASGQVQVDLTSVFTGDYVRNTGDTTEVTVDASGFALVTAGVAGTGLGLPNDGRFAATMNHPDIRIAATDTNNGDNAVLLSAGSQVAVSPPAGLYARLQVYSLATEGRATVSVVVAYTDGTTTTTNLTMGDWFDDPPATGTFYVIDGMDRWSVPNSAVERRADPAVFGFDVNVDSAKTLSTVTLRNTSTGAPRWVILGMTGETAGAAATDDTYVGNEDEAATANATAGVLANDMILDGGTPSARLDAPPRSGQITLNTDGSFRYMPNPDFNGNDVFTYVLESSNGGRSTARASIVVLPRNDPPVARPDAFGLVAPGVTTRFELLFNDDAGPDVGETLTIVGLSTTSAGGTVLRVSDTAVNYTAAMTFSGEETFTYVLGDGTPGSTATATVTVQVGLPMGVADAFSLDEDTTLNVTSGMSVLANDINGDDRGLLARIDSMPMSGGVSLRSDGAFVYTPNRDFFGTDRFTYQAENTFGGLSGPVEVALEVRPVNDPPTAVDDVLAAVGGQTVAVPVLENDTIAPDANETLRVVSVGSPSSGGRAEVSADGRSVVYVAATEFDGLETMTYTIDDGDPSSMASAVITATVTSPASPDAGLLPDLGTMTPDSGTGVDTGAAPDAGASDLGPPTPPVEDGCRCLNAHRPAPMWIVLLLLGLAAGMRRARR